MLPARGCLRGRAAWRLLDCALLEWIAESWVGKHMKLFNTLTRRKEEVVPLRPGHIRMYSCGPTVYRYIHIGNLRTFTMADWLRRALMHEGLAVLQVKNITDVGHMRQERLDRGEDKLISQARQEGRTAADIAAFYTEAFHEDERRLNILPAQIFPRATQHIQEMITLTKALEERGLAYSAGGNVYFDVQRFPYYGTLSGNQIEAVAVGVHEGDDSAKHNPEDFPLWKAAEPGREMAWESPWGRGFPGWHIECSAMALRYLGMQFDIHTGGVDNIFPHHENELAQSEGFTGRRWVSYWVHAQHLLTDGLKMAKSTGNAYTLDEILARGFEPMALRYLFTTAHYRHRLNFTFGALTAAQTTLRRLRAAVRRIEVEALGTPAEARLDSLRSAFDAAIADDLNLPRAMAVVWNLLRRPPDGVGRAEQCALLREWDMLLGLRLFEEEAAPATLELQEPIRRTIAARVAARRAGNYIFADELRAQIEAAGLALTDLPGDTRAYRHDLGRSAQLLTSSREAPDRAEQPARFTWSINLIARNNHDDLQRCLASIARNASGQRIQVVVIDNGSTDETLPFLQELSRQPSLPVSGQESIPVEVLFADHNLGFAGGRNATTRASEGRFVVLLDTSIELAGDIWAPLQAALEDPSVGVAGPYGLTTRDLREFEEAQGPDVDAVEGYLLAYRRELLTQIGPLDEKFRFYRLADIHWSFFIKACGLRAVALPEVAAQLIKHPHREWYSLTPEEQAAKSKKNYDLFRKRWHHGESLLVANMAASQRWASHDDRRHLDAIHTHSPDELPPPGRLHTHPHRHLADHEHAHPHYHDSLVESPEPEQDAVSG